MPRRLGCLPASHLRMLDSGQTDVVIKHRCNAMVTTKGLMLMENAAISLHLFIQGLSAWNTLSLKQNISL